ncbi:conserved hypothetical protein, partial [Ixodes scapularis]
FMQKQSSLPSNVQYATPNFQPFPSASSSNINPPLSQPCNLSQSVPNPISQPASPLSQCPSPSQDELPTHRHRFPVPSAFPMQPAVPMPPTSPTPSFPDPCNHQ